MEINRTELHEALSDAFTTIAEFSTVLESIDKSWADFAGVATTLPDGITNVIAKAIAQGWILKLIDKVSASPAANNPLWVAFVAHHQQLLAVVPVIAGADPFATTALISNRPFLGRPKLRTHLPQVGKGNNSRVLLVDGPRLSGKSYTNDFLQYLAGHYGFQAKYIDLEKERYSLEQLSERLQDDLALPLPIPQADAEQPPRWAERLARWVIRKSKTPDAQNRWLVFDGYRIQEPKPGVLDLVEKLAELVDGELAGDSGHFRLVLINFGSRLAESIAPGRLGEVAVAPDRSEFEKAFIDFCKGRATPEDPTDMFKEIETQAQAKAATDPDGPLSLPKWLNIGITKVAAGLKP